MKTHLGYLILALSLAPVMALAQNDPNSEGLGFGEDGPQVVIAQQTQSEVQPPPAAQKEKRQVEVHVLATPGDRPGMNVTFGPGLGAWWKNSEIVSKLNLSQEQVNKISQTYLDHKLKLIDLEADLEKQELRLQPLVDVDQPDASKVGGQIDLITAARGRLEKENAMMMLDIRRWLSVDQWKKLKAIEPAEEGNGKVFFYRSGPGMGGEGPVAIPLPDDLPVLAPRVRRP